jgi:NAD(P) transhydrogenase subunit alpha
MRIAVLKERKAGETRVAASPDSIKKFIAAGHSVAIESGAGLGASIPDQDYLDAGAQIAPDAAAAAQGANVVLAIRRPEGEALAALPRGAGLVALLDPYGDKEFAGDLAARGVDAFALEFTPRITRAQTMDVLSSQSNLAGYRAVIEAAAAYGRAFPMMMTAAGTVAPAKVFVMGAGVAGLQAIATARRLGAVVSATDVRPAAKEQVASLGAKFVAVEDEEFKAAETAGGYAKEMSAEYRAKQAELVASHVAKQDVVVTTALIPGRPAPRLLTEAMAASMKPGSVIVDMAVERGGNVEGVEPGKAVVRSGVTLIGYDNLPARLAADSSALFAKNLAAFLPLLAGEGGAYAPHWDDEIVTAMALTRAGEIVHATLK